jgi:phosphoenolpyruvate-protein phosphotransferase (PTS system enzyme I)
MALALQGISVFKGYAVGKARVLRRERVEVPQYEIDAWQVHSETERYRSAVNQALEQLRAIREQIPKHTPPDIAAFIDTHLLMLNDPTLTEGPLKLVKSHRCNAEWALQLQRDAVVDTFDEMDDAYLRTRKDDVDHVVQRIQRALIQPTQDSAPQPTDHLRGRIIVAEDVSPADTLFFQHHDIAGIVAERGGLTSHTAILARSLGIPALVGVAHVRRVLSDDETLIIDGQNGILIAGADLDTIGFFQRRQRELKRYRASLTQLRGTAAVTADRQVVTLYANIELPADIAAAKKNGAAGVGLYRTEFLFMDRDTEPDEEEQYHAYTRIVKAFKDAPVIIRTLDVGGDKPARGGALTDSTNPALGLRGVRYSLRDPQHFKTQLRAILRASAHGAARIMFPMLTGMQELVQVAQLLEEAKVELAARKQRFNARIPLGCVIETSAAALLAKRLVRCVNFLSIGTNDLVQYTLAVDRGDSEVAHLFDPLHPAVLMLIRSVIRAGADARVPVTLCGEMAGDLRYTRLLLGLGLREFSMNAASLLEVKWLIQNSEVGQLRARVTRLLASHTPQEALTMLERINK